MYMLSALCFTVFSPPQALSVSPDPFTYPRGARVVDADHHGEELLVVQPRAVDEGHGRPPRQRQRQQGASLLEEAAAAVHVEKGLHVDGLRHLGRDG